MKLSDFLIIYLACGAPFGVFFFLQHRDEANPFRVYLKSVILAFVWIPCAVRLLNDFVAIHFRRDQRKIDFDKRDDLQKKIARILFDSESEISLFEFREVFERYAGLTLELNSANENSNVAEAEIFRVGLRENINLASLCLQRRNRRRIEHHQALARKDFLRFVAELNRASSQTKLLNDLTIEFATALNDAEANRKLREIFEPALQSHAEISVKHSKEVLWLHNQPKQSSANNLSLNLPQTATATRKD